MNKRDIIRWAQEAGAYEPTNEDDWAFELVDLERFAVIVEKAAAVAEREKCAQLCEKLGTEVPLEFGNTDFFQCAAAIRARGDK